ALELRRTWPANQPDELLIDLRLYKPCQVSQRFLPAEITGLGRNGVRYPGLFDVHLRADQHPLQCDRDPDLAGQIGIVELVRVKQPLTRNELEIFTAERMPVAGREVPEGHSERPANLCFQLVHGAGKAV